MDWASGETEEVLGQEDDPLLLPPGQPAELQELCFSLGPSVNTSSMPLGRKISHNKSASDTWAFTAAGHDFLATLDKAAETAGHARHASVGGGLTDTSSFGQQVGANACAVSGHLGVREMS
jgi:hypothetical protein